MSGEEKDEQLVEAAREGDRAAFERLLRRHERQIYRLCFRYAGGHEDASELAQDTFVRAYRALTTFKGEAAFSTWLYRIAVNVCLNRKSLKAVPVVPLKDVARHPALLPGADEAMLRDEASARVRRAIVRLPPRQRATLVLRAYHDLSHEQIAAVLGTTAGASKGNFFHALRNLKRLLDEDQ